MPVSLANLVMARPLLLVLLSMDMLRGTIVLLLRLVLWEAHMEGLGVLHLVSNRISTMGDDEMSMDLAGREGGGGRKAVWRWWNDEEKWADDGRVVMMRVVIETILGSCRPLLWLVG